MRFWVLVFSSWLAVGVSMADAQTPSTVSPADTEVARLAFERGLAAYASGSFEEALTSFQRAYELTHDPQILYNVGTVADRLRRDELALESYETYLAAEPTAEDRANIEARIAAIRAALASRAVEPPPPDASTEMVVADETPDLVAATPTVTRARGPSEAGIILAIAGGVVALGGGALLIASAIEIDVASRVTTWRELMGPYERVPIVSAVGWLSLGIGAAIAGIGVGWIVADGGSEESSVALRVGPGTLALDGSF